MLLSFSVSLPHLNTLFLFEASRTFFTYFVIVVVTWCCAPPSPPVVPVGAKHVNSPTINSYRTFGRQSISDFGVARTTDRNGEETSTAAQCSPIRPHSPAAEESREQHIFIYTWVFIYLPTYIYTFSLLCSANYPPSWIVHKAIPSGWEWRERVVAHRVVNKIVSVVKLGS